MVKNLPAKAGDVRDMGLIPWSMERQPTVVFLPEYSILARIPRTEEPGRIQSIESQS